MIFFVFIRFYYQNVTFAKTGNQKIISQITEIIPFMNLFPISPEVYY